MVVFCNARIKWAILVLYPTYPNSTVQHIVFALTLRHMDNLKHLGCSMKNSEPDLIYIIIYVLVLKIHNYFSPLPVF